MRSVAIVVPHLFGGGGLRSVTRFLVNCLGRSGEFEAVLFSVATSYRDPDSVRLLAPSTWLRGVGLRTTQWEGRDCVHVGAFGAEIEALRFLPRSGLTRLLDKCDLVQVIAGSPAWAWIAARTSRPVALQVATLAREEWRATSHRWDGDLRRVWRHAMVSVTACLDRSAVRVPDVVFVENRWMQSIMGPAARVCLAPPGVDICRFHPGNVRDHTDRDGYILSVARFEDPRKRVGLLFRAYARLRACHRVAPRLVLAGRSAPRSEAWELASRLGIREHVEFLPNLNSDELAELYRGAALFVLASAEEGLGIVLLEAQASGLPVVATRTRGAETAVRHGITGLLSPVDDEEGLSASMETILASAELRSGMSVAARTLVETEFSTEVAGARFLSEYRRLLT